MRLRKLLDGIDVIWATGESDKEIDGIAHDSRQIGRNFAFVCYKGVTVDGHEYILDAIKKGATAVILERQFSLPDENTALGENITFVKVPDGRLALAMMAANWYDAPATKLKIIGITGTNGKTSTAHLIQSIFTAAGFKMGIMGSVGHKFGDFKITATTTTADALQLHQLLRKMVDGGMDSVVMEVTSHSLEQKRVAGIQFDIAVFTNLTQDHLDFHQNMQSYLDAKVKLFEQLKNGGVAILNADDNASNYIRERTQAPILTYGIQEDADLQVRNVDSTINALKFTLMTKKGLSAVSAVNPAKRQASVTSQAGEIDVKLRLLGEYNLYNALAAAGAGISEGVELEVIKLGLESATVPGRFELVDCGQDFAVVVDYAHTPDALFRFLWSARKITQGRLICVFGCGGDRDKGKRPIMGEIASEIADHVIITSDNPRTEQPDRIVAEIESGVKWGASYDVIVDRNLAIARGIQIARSGDLVAIAGKGHENYQEFKDKRIHFDDREVAAEHLTKGKNPESRTTGQPEIRQRKGGFS